MSLMLAAAGASVARLLATITITCATGFDGIFTTVYGFSLAFGSFTSFGSRSPTTFGAYTLDGCYSIAIGKALAIHIHGDTTAAAPFTKLVFASPYGPVTFQRSAADTPGGTYVGGDNYTEYKWAGGTGGDFPSSSTQTVEVWG